MKLTKSEKISLIKREQSWDNFKKTVESKNLEMLFTREDYINRKQEFFKYKCLTCNKVFEKSNDRNGFKEKSIKCNHFYPTQNVHICKICNKSLKFEKFNALVNHVNHDHNISDKEYYDLYMKKENEGICHKSDCNNETVFVSMKEGYREFCCIKCGQETAISRRKISNIEKYGVDSPLKCKEIWDKVVKTNLEKYGTRSPSQNKTVIEKTKQTCITKYGGVSPYHSIEVRDKIIETNLIKYGTETPAQNKEVQYKMKTATMKLYGTPNIFGSEIFKETNKKLYNEKYGCDYASQVPELIDKTRKVKREKYWDTYVSKLKIQKIEPLFDQNFYINEKNFEFKCLRCDNIFTSDKTEAHNVICGCLKRRSHFEDEIADTLKEYNIYEIDKNKFFYEGKKRLELDLYLEKYNLGIDYCGLYWHSEARQKNDYHYNKYLFFKNKGIEIIQIFESDWYKKQSIVTSIINNRLGISIKININECKLTEIDNFIYYSFLTDNDLDGYTNTEVKIGLFYNDDLIYVLGINRYDLNKQNGEVSIGYEIVRNCVKIGYCIDGGFHAMVNYFEEKYKPIFIRMMVDVRYFTGDYLNNNGFKLSHHTKPYYKYFKNNCYGLLDDEYFIDKKLESFLDKYDSDLTDRQNILNNKYYRIYDAGYLLYYKDFKY